MLEDDLRTTLTERAAEPAVQPDLLEQVRGGIRRSNRRRAAALGAAVLLVAVISVPVAISQSRSRVPVPLHSADPVVAGWEQPRLDPPAFPLTPGWAPPGAGQPRVGQVGPSVLLSYENGAIGYLEVEVGPEPGDWESEGDGSDESTTVSGRPARVRTVPAGEFEGLRPGDRYVGVRWQLTDGRWVRVLSTGRTTEGDALRFARGLRPGTVPVSPTPFTVATAPPGLRLQIRQEDYLCLAPPAALADRSGRGLCLTLVPAAERVEPDDEDERLTITGRPATLAGTEEGPLTLTVALADGRVLTVDVTQEDVPLTREQLIRFAEGITVRR